MQRDEWLRAARQVVVAEKVEAGRLVFVEEISTNTSLCAMYAWAPKGERARWSIPPNRGPNMTVTVSE
jgi:hypothetical protein